MTVPWYLMSAYAYYHMDDPILSDTIFDKLGQMMIKAWPDIKHIHKKKIKLSDLKAGTLLLKKEEYPSRVPGAIGNLKRETKPR